MNSHIDALVIGAGVSGLTVAICLAEAGLAVRVRTRQLPAVTSCAAGAIWGPYLIDDERVLPWSEQTRVILTGLAGDPGTGVRVRHGLEASEHGVPPPSWATGLAGFRVATEPELPAGFASGWWYSTPVIDMPVYLDYLRERLLASGGTIELGEVRSLPEAAARAPVVVNCAGVEAGELVCDPLLAPSRGQLVVVDNPGVDTFFAQHDESAAPVYYLPQGDRVVLGGSVLPGRTDLAPDAGIAGGILRRCATIDPAFGTARVVGHRVGLRPSRPRVRLEREQTSWGAVIHNYGHGGSGVTMSWGCALEVARLAGAYA